jgi:AraC-like DNA-binding protein
MPGSLSTATGTSWSLSEFLNQFEFRSQSWCFAEIGAGHAIRVPSGDVAYFYAVLEGEVGIHGLASEDLACKAGDVAFALSGRAHTLGFSPHARRASIPLLQEGGYVDSVPTAIVGPPPAGARVLCGRLKVRWPTGKRLQGMPDRLHLAAGETMVDLACFCDVAAKPGGAAVLTHLANLLFVTAFRDDAQGAALFLRPGEADPIDRARRYMELHPTHAWTVTILARKVGMGRSAFAARFAAQTGTTPIDMLIRERMKLATRLLETTDLKITEIAEKIGYKSEASFHHRFTSYFEVAPGEFRRQRRSVEEGDRSH